MPGGTPSRPRWRLGSRGRAALAALSCAALVGCAALLRSFDRTSSGLSSWDASLRALTASGRFDSALALTAPGRADAGDDLLRLEYEGLVAHYAGDLKRSRLALEAASHLADDRYTRSLTRIALSFISSDLARAYDPPLTDRVFLHYYGALDYLAGDHADGAAVEARKLEQALTLADPHLMGEAGMRGLAATLHTFAGAVFEATGRPGEAEVAYRLARRSGADSSVASLAADDPGGGGGTLVLAVEEGYVAHRVQRSLLLPLWPDELTALSVGAAAGASEQARAHDVALRVARRGLGSDHRVRPRRLRKDGGDPYLLRVAWPAFAGGGVPATRVAVRVYGATNSRPADSLASDPALAGPVGAGSVTPEPSGDAPAATDTGPTFDVSTAARVEFERDAPGILARTLVRTVAKRAAVEAVKDVVSKQDETLGEIAGLAANVTTALLEQADTRGWYLLPARVRLLRLRVPAGTDRIGVRISEAGRGIAGDVELGPVHVAAGEVTVVPVRFWGSGRGGAR